MKIVSAAQMRRIDRLTTESFGVPSLLLMENAGLAVVESLREKFPCLHQERITVLCGPGNNGGDGMVVARHLHLRGIKPRVILLADPSKLKGDARTNYQMFAKAFGIPQAVTDMKAWSSLKPEMATTSLFVDAIFGTGLQKPLAGFHQEVVSDLRDTFQGRLDVRWVAVDLPSGIFSDQGEITGKFLHATYTVTFTAPKGAHIFPPACEHVGEWEVKSIGTPPLLLEKTQELFMNLTTAADVGWLNAPRPMESHKGTYGHVLLVAGSRGKTGAAALAAQGAQRMGAGLVTLAAPRSAVPVIASAAPEFMTEAMPETDVGTLSLPIMEKGYLDRLVEDKTVLAVGPGLTTFPQTAELVRRIVEKYDRPLVLDADGLNAFAGAADKLTGKGRNRVLTPHPGEMARLRGLSTMDVQKRRVELAREFAARNQLTVVLKGARTLTAGLNGEVWVNSTGNPGMATGGMGDVLTGMIAGLMARYPSRSVTDVAAAAVYLHGLAGDLAAQRQGQEALIASDLLHAIPEAFIHIRKISNDSGNS